MKQGKRRAIVVTLLTFMVVAPSAHADDACTVVLCLSFSKWDEIDQCVPPVRKALRDAALGKPLKKCKMASADNSSTTSEAQVDSIKADRENCPTGYWVGQQCQYDGVIRVSVDGQTWTNTWWDAEGNTASQTCPGAPSEVQQDTSSLPADENCEAGGLSGTEADAGTETDPVG